MTKLRLVRVDDAALPVPLCSHATAAAQRADNARLNAELRARIDRRIAAPRSVAGWRWNDAADLPHDAPRTIPPTLDGDPFRYKPEREVNDYRLRLGGTWRAGMGVTEPEPDDEAPLPDAA